MPSLAPTLEVLGQIYPDSTVSVPPFRLLRAVSEVRTGLSIDRASRALRVRVAAVERLVEAPDPVEALLGCSYAGAQHHKRWALARRGVGQLVLAKVAEQVFEALYKSEMGTDELRLVDYRQDRNDTDYRVLNGQGRPVVRINIKFHGTLFRRAEELVGLESADCFALATYKIWQGLRKEETERLPYVFLIVSASSLTGEGVGQQIPLPLATLATLVRAAEKVNGLKKRDVEDRIVDFLVEGGGGAQFAPTLGSIKEKLAAADWRALSATRANRLLRELLFERVFAVRVPRFAQNYRNAELDMHFSLSRDLASLHDFLRVYKDGGLHALTSQLARGDI